MLYAANFGEKLTTFYMIIAYSAGLVSQARGKYARSVGLSFLNNMTSFQESARCPVCLEIGKMFFQHGNYCCLKCDQCFRSDRLDYWMKAFEKGRAFERDQYVDLGEGT